MSFLLWALCFPFDLLDRKGVLVLVGVGVIVFLATSARRPANTA